MAGGIEHPTPAVQGSCSTRSLRSSRKKPSLLGSARQSSQGFFCPMSFLRRARLGGEPRNTARLLLPITFSSDPSWPRIRRLARKKVAAPGHQGHQPLSSPPSTREPGDRQIHSPMGGLSPGGMLRRSRTLLSSTSSEPGNPGAVVSRGHRTSLPRPSHGGTWPPPHPSEPDPRWCFVRSTPWKPPSNLGRAEHRPRE